MPNNPYDSLLEEDATRLRAQQSATLVTAVDTKPDAYAAQRNVAKYLGYTPGAVAATPEESQRQFTVKKVKEDSADYPELQVRYSTDEFAKLAHDDSGPLAQIGGQLVKAAKYITSANEDGNTLVGDIARNVPAGYHDAAGGTAGVFRAGAELAAPALDLLEHAPSIGGNPLRRLAEGFGYIAHDEAAAAKAAAGPSTGIIDAGIGSGIRSTVGNVIMLPMALLGPGGEAAALTAMSASQGGQSYQKAREAGVNPYLAAAYGASDAVIEYATEKIPVSRLLKDLTAGKSLVKTTARQVIPEVIGEQVATALQDLNEWAAMPENKNKPFSEYLKERPAAAAQTLIATLVGTGGTTGVMKSIQVAADAATGKQRQVEQADVGAEHLKAMFDLAAASKLRERAPDTFAEYVNAQAEASGAPTHVYIDARTLAGEGGLLNQDKVAELLPSVVPQLAEALATGGDVQIPIGELTAHVAGTPLEQTMLEHLRATPESLSQAEAKEASKQAEEFMQTQVERVLGQAGDATAIVASAEKVKAAVLEQLTAANRFTPDVHEAYSSLVRDFYTVTAARLGIAPEALYARYPLRVQSTNPLGEDLAQDDGSRLQPDGEQPTDRRDLRGAAPKADFATGTRIKSKGQPARVFRGSADPLHADHFGVGALGKASGNPSSGLGVWFTPDRGEAGRYGKVEEFQLDLRNPKHFKIEDLPSWDTVEEAHAFARQLEAQGHDGIVVDAKHLGGAIHAVAFQPESVIRSQSGEFRQAARTVIPTGPQLFPDVVSKLGLSQEEIDATALKWMTGMGGDMQFLPPHVGGIPEVVGFLQEQRKASGLPPIDIATPEGRTQLARLMAAEALAHIKSAGDSLAWYDQTIESMLNQMAVKYPELDTNPHARTAFLLATAIASQGMNPEANLRFASEQYEQFRQTGKFPEVGKGESAPTMTSSFRTANVLMAEMGPETFRRFLATPFTRRELEDAGFPIGGEKMDELLLGSSVFGPKIGFGFFSNLNGNFEPVTMDMWFMRTQGRLAGTLPAFDPEKFAKQLERFRTGLTEKGKATAGIFAKQFDPELVKRAKTDDAAALELARLVKAAHEKDFRTNRKDYDAGTRQKTTMVAAADTMILSMDKPRDVPGSGGERQQLRDVVKQMVDLVTQHHGQRIPPAALQALIWYPEQELYSALGVKLSVTSTDYSGSARKQLLEEGIDGTRLDEAVRAATQSRSGGVRSDAGANDGAAAAGSGQRPSRARPLEAGERSVFLAERARRRAEAGVLNQSQPGASSSGALSADSPPLIGLPSTVKVDGREVEFGPYAPARAAAAQYMATSGIEYTPAPDYAKADSERGQRIAAAFEAMKHDPSNPVVKAAYDAMIEETLAQYETILATGLKVEFIDGNDPYGNPRNAILDVVDNNHLFVFSTRDGFGSDTTFDPKDNPLLAETKFKDANGKPMLANDVFRVVHDYFGHVKEGVGFRADGEENAWRAHAAMYSPLARRAMTTETRGQNSWVNFGPKAEANKTASGTDTAYADQKIGLLPEWVTTDGLNLPSALSSGKGGNLINIGLDIPSGGKLSTDQVLAALRGAGATVRRSEVHQSDTEQTLVAELSQPLADAEAHALSTALGQESVAQLTGDTGAMHGPEKDKWGAFNPDYFLMLDGSRASGAAGALNQGPRGTFSPSSLTVSLLESADLTTFLHETGHFFLEVTADLASQPGAPADVQADMVALLKWFGVKDLATWNAMSLEQKRPSHEKFAESFEQYLFEGKAPSHELSSLFAKFRSWMTSAYKSLTSFMASHDTQLSDEIRHVFNRMLASQDAIAAAEDAREYASVFESAEQAGMDPVAWLAYQDQGAKATDEAIAKLQKRSLRDMQWASNARSRELKRLQREAAKQRKVVEAEVTAEVDAMPVYAVQKFVSQSENTRLPDELTAEMFGFSSADEMKAKVTAAQPREVMIEGMTDQRLLERFGDLTSEAGIRRAADEAVHNEARAKFVATELKALQQATQPVNVLMKAAKEFAGQLVARRKVRELRPGQHLQAETRAARASQQAMGAGDTKAAAIAKRDQLLNHYAAKETQAALAEIEKAVKKLKAFATNTSLPPEYLEQIHALLERFDLKAASLTEIDKRKSLVEWVEAQRAIGVEPELPPGLLDAAQRKHYKDMTVEEFRGLVDTIKQIEHLGQLKSKLLTAKDKREFDAIKQDLVDSIEANAGDRQADIRSPVTNKERFFAALRKFGTAHIKAATWARVFDGGKDGGHFWERFVRPANERADMEGKMRADATKALSDIMAPVLKGMTGKPKFFPSINRSLPPESVFAIALNVGNAGNLQRLLGGEGWTVAQVQPVLDSLTKEQWAAVQKIWDHFETYRPLIGEKHKRIYGVEPKWIEPVPVVTPHGTLPGGYYPIKYDPSASVRAEEHADAEGAKRQLQGAYSAATTRRSFTKIRAEEVTGRPLLYSLAGVYSGVNDVIHDLAWHEWLIDVNRLLKSTAIDSAIRNAYGPAAVNQLKTWRDAIAEGDQAATQAMDQVAGFLRQGVSAAGLGFNVMSAAMQPLGITQSIVRVGAGWVGKGIGQYIAAPIAMTRKVRGESEFMAARARTQFRELAELRNRVQGQSKLRADSAKYVYFMMMKAQEMVDVPTWLGAHEKAIAEGNGDERAVALADQAVIDSQGDGTTNNLSAIQRGTQLTKLFTVFYSFMNTALNLGVAQTMTSKSKGKLAADYALLFVVPAVLGSLLKDALTPGDSGDDDWKKVSRKLIGEQLSFLMGLMVGTREVASAGKLLAGEKGAPYTGPAGVRIVGDAIKATEQAKQAEFDDSFRKAAINLVGDATGLPAAQTNRTITGAKAIKDGKTKNPLAILFGYQEAHK